MLGAAVRLWLNWKRAKETPAVAYEVDTASQSLEEQWHWAEPPEALNLVVNNSETESVINFSVPQRFSEAVCNLFAAFFGLLGIYLIGVIIYRYVNQQPMELLGSLIIVALIFVFAWVLTRTNTPILSITRAPDYIKFDIRQAYYKQRSFYLRAPIKPGTVFKNELQSFLAMNNDQVEESPDYYLLLKRPWKTDQRFILRVQPNQAGWIVDGLNQWIKWQQNSAE